MFPSTLILLLIFNLCVVLDFISTKSLVKKLGTGIELNPLLKMLSDRFGDVGLALGIVLPNLLFLTLIGVFHLPSVLAFATGARAMLAYMQILRKQKLGF